MGWGNLDYLGVTGKLSMDFNNYVTNYYTISSDSIKKGDFVNISGQNITKATSRPFQGIALGSGVLGNIIKVAIPS